MNFQMATAAITGVLGLLTVLTVGLSGLLQLIRQMLDELAQVIIKIGDLRRALRSRRGSRSRV